MATTFLEPGGDGTFNVATTTAGGFWDIVNGAPAIATDFVNTPHLKSIRYRPANQDLLRAPAGVLSDAGSRYSVYIYLVALPSSTATIMGDNNLVHTIRITSAGVLQIWALAGQIGSSGPTLLTGRWYRISLAYTVTDSNVNRFELFVNGNSGISITNAALGALGSSTWKIGNNDTNSTLDFRSSDHYIDNSSSLTDPGNIFVTAKRPISNGTVNNFSTQIGSAGSEYGTGHAQQVNERALSTTNGWSMVGAGSAVTEQYSIEKNGQGDMSVGAQIIDYAGWVYASSVLSETGQIVVGGSASNISLTNTSTLFRVYKGSTAYPAGGTDIGIITSTDLTTVSLYECGILVAFIPPGNIMGNYEPFIKVGGGMGRSERAT